MTAKPVTNSCEEPLCLRIEEAARLLGISRSKAYQLVATGDISSVEIGGLRRVPRAALEAMVETCEGTEKKARK